MKDFRVRDIIDEVRKELPPYIPRALVSKVIRYFLKRVYGIITLRTNARFIFYECELNQIYPDIRESEEMQKFFDLNETKSLSLTQVRVLNDLERYEREEVYNKIGFSNRDPRIRVRRRGRRRFYPKDSSGGINQEVPQS